MREAKLSPTELLAARPSCKTQTQEKHGEASPLKENESGKRRTSLLRARRHIRVYSESPKILAVKAGVSGREKGERTRQGRQK